jgi:hypothetical protein
MIKTLLGTDVEKSAYPIILNSVLFKRCKNKVKIKASIELRDE